MCIRDRFNTAIAEMMVFVNEATKASAIPRDWFEMFVKILSAFAPHLGEELWQRLGHTQSIAYEPWPAHDEAKLIAAAQADPKVQSFVGDKPIKRAIYVKGRLVNLVV